ncbi:MAG TPA: protease pro-enzyme activation domain-containing protein [Gammaproteobacteria bacterium]|nr:protease pro-enzyme activation domain-containing protein [Gammaproteobacteria bacterium]
MKRSAKISAAAICAGVFFGSVALASASQTPADYTPRTGSSAGLSQRSMTNAQRDAHAQPLRVTMAPQSSFKLLKQAVNLGPHAAKANIELTIGLKLNNLAQLHQFLRQVQNPHSSVYHQWLTPKQFTARYGPTSAQVKAVTGFLENQGIHVRDVSPNRLLIHTEAPTANYENAFGIHINDYKLNGRHFFSTENAPKIPAAVAPLIANVIGLNNAVQMRPHNFTRPANLQAAVAPRAAPPAQMTEFNPLQIAKAYDWPDITSASNGSGVTVAILTADSSGIGAEDSPHKFWSAYGLPDHTITVTDVNGNNGMTDGMVETLLDVSWSGAMGPGISIHIYDAGDRSFSTFTDMYNQFVNDNSVQVMTTSWGGPETATSETVTDEAIFMQAAAQGISMFAAAGDHGSGDGTGQANVADYPSASKYVTAANGTQLTISNIDGSYGSEVAWNDADCFGNGPGSTGGAVSQTFTEPGWQTGPNVPNNGWRNNSDLALNASCSHPLFLYIDGSWVVTAGTSAVAPQLAALFAIATSENGGERLGNAPELIYNDVNAGNYTSDFHDVISGSNGAFDAGPNWDHPTGWGTPDAQNLLSHIGIQGPKGTLSGTVTDATTGKPISGARITAVAADGTGFSTLTADDGSYSRLLPIGDFTVTVTDFGYQKTSTTVTVTDGGALTHDFSLNTAPKATVQGNVTDGSGHEYGLYAEITVSTIDQGQVADVWTNPTTGAYSVQLPIGSTYEINATPALNGYNPGEATLDLTGDATQNFALTVITTCTAPGYAFQTGGFGQDFNGTFPPNGWTVTNASPDSTTVWKVNSDWSDDNWTGGTGTAADANEQYGSAYDTSLISPPIDVSTLPAIPQLKFKLNFQNSSREVLDVDISTDGGTTWTTMAHLTGGQDYGDYYGLPGAAYAVRNLGSFLGGATSFQLRWRYHLTNSYAFGIYAQIDDVVIGGCAPVPGGLVYGQVTDSNTGAGVVGAKVSDDLGDTANTVENAADPNLPSGTYLFFAPAGNRTLTVVADEYTPTTASVDVVNNGVQTQDFALKSADITVDPDAFMLHVMVNQQESKTLTLKNTGDGTGQYRLFPVNAPSPATSVPAAQWDAAPLKKIPLHEKSIFMRASRLWLHEHGYAANPQSAVQPAAESDGAWTDLGDMPLGVADNTGARDPATGMVYSIGGYNGSHDITAIYAYDPEGPAWSKWSKVADLGVPVENSAVGFINGKLYAVDGWGPHGVPVATLEIYDPATGKVTTGADNPVPAGGAPGAAVLDGKLYVVGGCNDGQCSTYLTTVQVYDPATNSWSSAPDYPHGVDFLSCGGIEGKLYCAGGAGPNGGYADGYMYDPAYPAAGWTAIADIPVEAGGMWGSGYIASLGKLLISGGVANNALTNAGYAYDPLSDTWSDLPPASDVVYRGASACGFYRMGGYVFGGTLTASAEVLPGYSQCGSYQIPWLTASPLKGTMKPDGSVTVSLTFDGSGQKEYTTSKAYLAVTGGPKPIIVPLAVTWDPQPVDLAVSGAASPQTIQKNGDLTYVIAVQNLQAEGHGAATQTELTSTLPEGVSYIASKGDADCSTSSGSSGPADVVCDFGTINAGGSKLVALVLRASQAGTLKSTFSVSSREPDSDASNNTATLDAQVVGTSDLNATATSVSMKGNGHGGDQADMTVTVANAGPDAAGDVVAEINIPSMVSMGTVNASQGTCANDGDGRMTCSLGDIAAGGSATVALALHSTGSGTGQVTVMATTSGMDPNPLNNYAQGGVTVSGPIEAGDQGPTGPQGPAGPQGPKGGDGGLGLLGLLGMLGLALTRARMMKGRRC